MNARGSGSPGWSMPESRSCWAPTSAGDQPLDDIRNTRRIAQVYLRGIELDRAALRAKWAN